MPDYALPSAFRIGFGSIDDEHDAILALLSRIHAADGSGTPKERVATFLTELADHFAAEERLMAELRYPREIDHREHHRECLAAIASAMHRTDGDGGPTAEDLNEVFSILIDTVVRVDLYFEEFLIGIGRLPNRAKPL
jgi:hemerythrin-like metal-binding protein